MCTVGKSVALAKPRSWVQFSLGSHTHIMDSLYCTLDKCLLGVITTIKATYAFRNIEVMKHPQKEGGRAWRNSALSRDRTFPACHGEVRHSLWPIISCLKGCNVPLSLTVGPVCYPCCSWQSLQFPWQAAGPLVWVREDQQAPLSLQHPCRQEEQGPPQPGLQ